MKSHEYTIAHKPIPWKRPGKNDTHFYDTQKNEKLVYGLSIVRTHGNLPKFEGPLFLEVIFYMPIPKLLKKRQQSKYHWTVPDIDNCLKHLLDSINKTETVWHDDRQVAKLHAEAIYDKEPRVYFKITELV